MFDTTKNNIKTKKRRTKKNRYIMERFEYKPKSQRIKDKYTGYTYPCNSKELYKLLEKINTEKEQYT